MRAHHQGHQGGIGRNYQFIQGRSAQGQRRHPLRRILVGHGAIAPGIGGLRHAPGHALLFAKYTLRPYRMFTSTLQQAAPGFVQHQGRHQVLKHRAGPRFEPRLHPIKANNPPQGTPVRGVDIALGNRQQAGQPGFGGQQVIKGVVQLLLTHPVANMKQAPAGAVQKPVVRRQRQGLHAPGQHLKLGALRITRHRHTVAPLCTKIKTGLGGGEQVATQVAAVDGGHIGGQQHCQGLGVVPVQKMPLVPGQLVQRVQRGFQAGGQIGHADPARVCCAGAAQEV